MLLVFPFVVQQQNGYRVTAYSWTARIRPVWQWVCRLGKRRYRRKPANRRMAAGTERQRAGLIGLARHKADKEQHRAGLAGMVRHKADLEADPAVRPPRCVMRALRLSQRTPRF